MYTGLGEYPGYVCYDASRPSWLPNWLDTWAESACKLRQAPQNVASCLNPLSTQCSPDSWINLNTFSGTPNYDPNVSGSGILGAEEGSNAPPGLLDTVSSAIGDTTGIKNLTFNPGTALLIAAGIGALLFIRR